MVDNVDSDSGIYPGVTNDDEGKVQLPRIGTVGTDTTVSVSTSSTLLLAANDHRKMAYFSNNGGAIIYLRLGSAASSGVGIKLNPGSVFFIGAENLWTGAVYGIKSGGGSGSVDVFEGLI